LIACHMNGDELPPAHGGPLRAVIPGWYGMDSVKWLQQVDLVGENTNLTYLRRRDGAPVEPVTAMLVKAAFARPLDGAILSGRRFLVHGAAWAGEQKVAIVELSTDGGHSWKTARLRDAVRPYVWVRWESEWTIAAPGDYELVVRAADSTG